MTKIVRFQTMSTLIKLRFSRVEESWMSKRKSNLYLFIIVYLYALRLGITIGQIGNDFSITIPVG